MAGHPAASEPSPLNVLYCTCTSEVIVDVGAEDVDVDASVEEDDRLALVDELEDVVEVELEVEVVTELEVEVEVDVDTTLSTMLELDKELKVEVDVELNSESDADVDVDDKDAVLVKLVVLVAVGSWLELVSDVELEEVEVRIEASEINVSDVAGDVEISLELIVLEEVLDAPADDELDPWKFPQVPTQ
ncbi:hypothetical protein LTR86_010145 [Recurvomyces mirabilis]|nr:hypothetical protein LTR86_010145 [Recurvomyces mirabilis]